MFMKTIYKKAFISVLAFWLAGIFFAGQTQGQQWTKLLPQQKVKTHTLTLTDYQKAFKTWWNEEKAKKSGAYVDEELRDENYAKFKRWEWYWESRVNPVTGAFPNKNAYEVYQQYITEHPSVKNISGFPWSSLGPTTTPGGYAGLGRVNCVAFSPVDSTTIYIGSASGGVWKTTDLGNSWKPLGDHNEVLGVSDIIVVNNGGQDVVYLATGDKDHWDTYSVGVLKSTDGGTTWNTTGLKWKASQYGMIFKLLMDPNNQNVLYAATNGGVFKTSDAGNTWVNINSLHFRDIVFQPGSSTRMTGSTYSGSIYFSEDSGKNWIKTVSTTAGGRTQLTVTPDSSNVVYAIMANKNNYGFYGFYKSIDTGRSFVQIPDTLNLLGWACGGTDTGGQGWYDLTVVADPHNAQRVFVGGVNTWMTEDGGKSWKMSNHWSSDCGGTNEIVHADKHDLVYQNGTDALFECNDGGIYKTNDGKKWNNISNGLVISQIYRLGTAATKAGEVINGLQDNGTKLLYNGNWDDVAGGDGMECLIDYTADSIQYAETPNGSIRRTTDRWISSKKITNGLSGSGAWVTPYVMDPVNSATLYIGYDEVYKTTNRGDMWNKISSFGTGAKIRSMAIAPSNNKTIYAATRTKLYQTVDGGKNWVDITGSLPVDKASITYIAVKNNEPNTIWITMGGYGNSGVYQSKNSGVTWSNISEGLPSIPVNCIVQNKLKDTTQLYVGTDVGVYVRQGYSKWTPYFDQLPNVVVDELEIRYDNAAKTGVLYGATFGRGLWKADLFQGYIAPILTADFEADITDPTVKDTVRFKDLSTNNPTAWKWKFQPSTLSYLSGTDSTSQNPVVKFNKAGFYTVTLTAIGKDTTLTKTLSSYILVKDVFHVNVSANRTIVPSGDTTQLFAKVYGGSGSYTYSWSSRPFGFSSKVANPVITPKNDTTTYVVVVMDGSKYVLGQIVIYRVESAGINDSQAITGKINIYPNPNTGKFTVQTEKTIQAVRIINQAGQVVYKSNFKGKRLNINIPSLSKGIYFIQLDVGNANKIDGTAIRKMIIR